MKIATWNINSVRLRAPLVKKFLQDNDIDILCLQETKTQDEFFPKSFFEELGYTHTFFSGQKSYNGVAVISRVPIKFDNTHKFVNEDKRHISAHIKHRGKDIELHNLYIPAGGDIPDRKENPKFGHKLDFIGEITKHFPKNSKGKEIIVLGDFNIAPYEHDVWSHKQLLKIVSHTPVEVELLEKFRKSFDFVDIAREFIPHDKKLYSWWSYRNPGWKENDKGRRLDHIWGSQGIAGKVKKFNIVKDTREWTQTSDHVPVIIEL